MGICETRGKNTEDTSCCFDSPNQLTRKPAWKVDSPPQKINSAVTFSKAIAASSFTRLTRNASLATTDESPQKAMSELHKNAGKKSFICQDFAKAINEYTLAIEYCSNESVYYLDRALCYRKLMQLPQAISDLKKALSLNANYFKANYTLASCLYDTVATRDNNKDQMMAEDSLIGDIAILKEAIRHIDKSYLEAKRKEQLKSQDNYSPLCSPTLSSSSFGVLTKKRLKIRKLHHVKQAQQKKLQHAKTFDYVRQLLTSPLHNAPETPNSVDTTTCDRELLLYDFIELVQLNKTHPSSPAPDHEIPDYLIAKISFDMHKDPVLTPDGITYEQSDLQQHFEKIGYYDPITRRELDENRIVPNKTIMDCVEDFIEKNPWAYDDSADEEEKRAMNFDQSRITSTTVNSTNIPE